MPSGERSLSLGIVLAGLVALTFLPVLHFGFVTADDVSHVTGNVHLSGPLWFFWRSPFQGLYVPLTYSAWWAAWRLGGTDPLWFHGLNWLLHAFNGALAFGLIRRMGLAAFPAAIGALIFALHPLQVEAVAWVSALKDVLCGTFALLSLLAALEGRWRWGSLAFGLCLLAKPAGAAVPIMAALLLWARSGSRGWTKPLFYWGLPAAAILVLTKSLQPGPRFSWVERTRIALDSLAFSLSKVLLPLRLTLNDGRTPEGILGHSSLLPAALALVLLALAWRFRNHRSGIAAGALFIAAWLPVSGAVSFVYQIHSTTADRFCYLPLLGIGILGALLAERRPLSGGILAVLCLVLTRLHAPVWRDNVSLYGQMAAVHASGENEYRYGMSLAEAGHKAEAASALARAAILDPSEPKYANNLALLLAEAGRYGEAEAELRAALERSPGAEVLGANLTVLEKRRRSKGGKP